MKSSALFSTSILALATVSGVAQAQENANTPLVQNTITVTVQKREENLRDVPVALTAIDGQALADLGLDEFDQVARFVPGFEVQEQSPNNPGFVIRGLTSDSGEANIEPRIAVFQDGVSISRSRGSVIELFDMERVEVAKGPQPTLFGRGALIGGVNVIQAKPNFELGGEITAGVGNLNERFAEGYLNVPLVEDQLAFRIAGRMRERDGYVESVNPNEDDFNSQDMRAIRGSLTAIPVEDLRFDLIYNYQVDRPSGTSFKSKAFLPSADGSSEPWDPANLNSFGGFLGGKKLGLDRDVQSLTLLTNWDINDALSLTSITGWREIDSLEVFDPDGFGLELLIFAEDYTGEQYSQEFRLNYDAGGRVKAFGGVSFFDETGQQSVPLTYDERAVQALLAGLITPPNAPSIDQLPAINLTAFLTTGAVIPLKPIHNEIFTNYADTQTIDLFGDITFEATDRLELTAGVRYTEDDKTSGLLVEMLNGPSNLTFGGIFVQESNGLIEASDTFNDVTYRAAAKFALTQDVNLFANISRGRRPEVITASASNPSAGFTTLDAEIVDAAEIGFKGLFLGGNLSLDGSLYYYDYSNFQSTIVNDAGLIVPVNAGDATAEGLELQASWTPTANLAVVGSYGYNKARFDNSAEAQNPGNRLRLSPDHTASIAGVMTFDLGFGDLKVVPSYTWQSEVYFDNTERELISEDAYGLANLNVELDLPNGFGVEAYVTNLLDEEYIIDAGNTGDAFGIPTFIAGAPQFYGIRAKKSF